MHHPKTLRYAVRETRVDSQPWKGIAQTDSMVFNLAVRGLWSFDLKIYIMNKIWIYTMNKIVIAGIIQINYIYNKSFIFGFWKMYHKNPGVS